MRTRLGYNAPDIHIRGVSYDIGVASPPVSVDMIKITSVSVSEHVTHYPAASEHVNHTLLVEDSV